MIRAVVFDFDGVIANSEPLHFGAFRDVLREEGVAFTEAEYYERYLGYDDLGVFRTLVRDRGLSWSEARIAALGRQKAVRLADLEQTTSILFPGAEDAVRRLAAEWPLAIASGALRAEIRRVLDQTRLTGCFGVIVGAEDAAAGKPAPDPYLLAVAQLARQSGQPLAPAECVAVEDSRWGLESARAAGLRTVAVTHTYAAAELGAADLVIDSLEALQPASLRRIVEP